MIGVFFSNSLWQGASFLFTKISDKSRGVAHSAEVQIIEKNIRDILEVEVNEKKQNKGLLMFRGNLTRTYYGEGSILTTPKIFWKYGGDGMCANSTVAGETKQWCGTGWTGQPIVWEKENGKTEIIFGAYDKNIHFVDKDTGTDTRNPFPTGDIIKGSATLDPDGFPLLYFGSRDNKLRIGALDRGDMIELWSLDASVVEGLWNNDWDSNPIIIDDILYEGGENGWFFAIKLNRHYDEFGNVSVDPKIIFKMPSYDDVFLDKLGDSDVSIESSLAVYQDRIYFSNSGGRILGLDISKIEEGVAPVVFDYWTGDDTDATLVIDANGMLYVAVEEERYNQRSKQVGQLLKLDPYNTSNPLVWNIFIEKPTQKDGGIWATPALSENYLYVPTNKGDFLVVEKDTGEVVWKDFVGIHAWSSPVIYDKNLYLATCDGRVLGYSLENKSAPEKIWQFNLPSGACIESTPALWDNTLYFGARDGFFYSLR